MQERAAAYCIGEAILRGEKTMNRNEGIVFEPETIDLMRSVLDAAWASLLPEQQASVSRTLLAERILSAAAEGERDPARLRVRALFSVAPSQLKAG
jgi:hypothetical protein